MSWVAFNARGRANWDFASGGSLQIDLTAGDTVKITEEVTGWYRGQNEVTGAEGIFPSAYIELISAASASLGDTSVVGSSIGGIEDSGLEASDDVLSLERGDKGDDILMTEIDTTLTTCNILITKYTSSGDVENYSRAKARIATLMEWRRKVIDDMTPPSSKLIIRTNIVKLIEATRQMVEGFMVPRTQTGEMASSENTGIMQLYQMHRDMQVRMEEGTNLPNTVSGHEQMEITRGIRRGKGVINYALGGEKTTEADAKRVVKKKKILQLLMEQQMVACGMSSQLQDEKVEIYYGLWSTKSKNYITEEYAVKLTAQGFPEDLRLHEKIKTVFHDLSLKELENVEGDSIYLAIRLFRTGSLVYDPKKKKKVAGEGYYRRPWGVSALPISKNLDHLADLKSFETRANIYKPLEGAEETEFSELLQNIIDNNGKYVIVPTSLPIALKFQLLHGDLDELRDDERYKKSLLDASISQKLALPEIMSASDTRNDFYITLLGANVLGDRKTSEKNVFVKVTLLTETGKAIECMSRGTGVMSSTVSEYQSSVIYHSNTPYWNEVLHLKLDGDATSYKTIGRGHLLFVLYHASSTANKTSPFSFGFLPLSSESGVCIGDKIHEINTYTPLPGMFSGGEILPTYLSNSSKNPLVPRSGETIQIQTLLVSTNRTTNAELHDLLRWRELSDASRLKRVLESVTYMADQELGRFMRAIIDALMGVFSHPGYDTDMIDKCFISFLHVLNKVTDKYSVHRNVLDSYLGSVFKDRNCFQVLIDCMKRHMKWVLDEKANPKDIQRTTLTNAIKVFPTLLDFIVKSWTCSQEELPPGSPKSPKPIVRTKEQFTNELVDLMGSINQMMAKVEPVWLSIIQTLVLKNFAPIFEQFATVLDADILGDVVKGFLDSIVKGGSEEVLADKGRAMLQIKQASSAKLFLVRDLVRGSIFKIQQSRRIVMAAVVRMAQYHINKSEAETVICISIIKELVRTIQAMNSQDDVWNMSVMLSAIASAVLTYQKEDSSIYKKHVPGTSWLNIKKGIMNFEEEPGKVLSEQLIIENDVDEISDAVTAMLNIIILLDDDHITYYMSHIFPNVEEQRSFMLATLKVFRNLLKIPLYPEIWLIMNMVEMDTIVKVLNWFSASLMEYFLPENNEQSAALIGGDMCVYSQFFSLALELFSEKTLQIELALDKRKEFMTKVYGDKRLEVIEITNRVWKTMNRGRVSLSKLIVEPIMKITASPVEKIASFARDLLLDILKDEYIENKNFKHNEIFMIDFVASNVHKNVNLPEEEDPLMRLFSVHLPPKFKSDKVLNCAAGSTFLEEIALLFKLLRALGRYDVTLDYEDERTSATLTLLSYLKRTQRFDMYINQVIQFSLNHKKLNNYVEAGKTLLLYAAILDFSDKPLEAITKFNYKAQTQGERKEQVIRDAMALFSQASDWETCIKLLRELQTQYETVNFDFRTASSLLKEQAELFDKITKVDRLYPTYFLLSSIGVAHDKGYQNKEFIYRGNILERVGEFTSRVKHKFGGDVNMLKAGKEPSDVEANGPEKLLRIITVACTFPEEYQGLPLPAVVRAPGRISSYAKINNVKVFTYQRPFRKRDKKSANEFLDLWVIKAYLVTEESFPSTHRRMEVIERVEITLNPLENAVCAMEEKNQMLKDDILAVNEGPDREAPQAFTMSINGTVDACVAGGVKNYIVFFNGEYETTHPEIKEDMKLYPAKANLLDKLRYALGVQISIVEYGMDVHSRKCAEAMLPLHEHLKGRYVEMLAMMKMMTIEKIPVKKWY